METAWQVAHAVDGLQTLAISRDPCFEERAPVTRALIGNHPSEEAVVAWWAGMAVAHALVSRSLERWPRVQKAWQGVTLVNTAAVVYGNHQVGLRIDQNNVGGCR